MSWTAIVPLKLGPERKSRLASRLSQQQREALADEIAAHVLDALKQAPSVARVVVLAPRPFGGAEWRKDEGAGLNAELAAARSEIAGALVVIHGDLPLVAAADIEALLEAGSETGVAIAADRHGAGTNAIALSDGQPFHFAFGVDSRRLHARGAIEIVRPGLSLDIDTTEDLDAALAAGWTPSRSIKIDL
ncbi:hypothetical protein U91I_03963 [alpha proteobacterium U9-1i]|nr:hypothetical protein U91I_03963 [alpha proteobacterium U9-1i]